MKRLLLFFKSFLVLVALLAGASLAALAAEVTEYTLFVGGVQVTSLNKDDILEDGGKAKFNPETYTLTLDNPKIDKGDSYDGLIRYGDQFDLKIDLKSPLTLNCSKTGSTRFGIRTTDSRPTVTINGDVTITDADFALYLRSKTILNGNYTFKQCNRAISFDKGDVIITGNVNADCTDGPGIGSIYGNLSIDGDVNISSLYAALEVAGDLTIKSGTWTLKGSSTAIASYKDIIIPTSYMIRLPEKGIVSQVDKIRTGNNFYFENAYVITDAEGTTPAKEAVIGPAIYPITVTGGKVYDDQANVITYAEGDQHIRVYADAVEGKYITGWTMTAESGETTDVQEGYEGFTMPDESITLTPKYADQMELVIDFKSGAIPKEVANQVYMVLLGESSVGVYRPGSVPVTAAVLPWSIDLDKDGTKDIQFSSYDNLAVLNGTNLTGTYVYEKLTKKSSWPLKFIFGATTYPLWVGNTQVTEDNLDDILGDGGKAKFNPETNTLTLDNPTIEGYHVAGSVKSIIYTELDDLIMSSTSDIKLSASKDVNARCITAKNLTVNSNFELTSDLYNTYSVYVDGQLEINGNLTFTHTGTGAQPIYASGDIMVNGDVDISSKASGGAIYSNGGSLKITGNVNVENSGTGQAPVYANGDIIIDGDVDISSPATGGAIYASSGALEITGNLKSEHTGGGGAPFCASKDITINGDVDVSSNAPGGTFVSYGGSIKMTSDNLVKIKHTGTGTSPISASQDVIINGNVDVSSAAPGGAVYSGGGIIDITGDVAIEHTGTGSAPICSKEKIIINGDVDVSSKAPGGTMTSKVIDITGDVTIQVLGSYGSALEASNGISVKGDVDITSSSSNHGIFANESPINIEGKVDISMTNTEGNSIALYTSNAGITITGDVDVETQSSNHAILNSGGELLIDGNVKAKSAKNCAIYANNITINGDAELTGGNNCAVFAQGDVTIDGDVTASNIAAVTVLEAMGKVKVVSGTWKLGGGDGKAITADGGIAIPSSHYISTPEGGKVIKKTIETTHGTIDNCSVVVNKEEADATYVVIEPCTPIESIAFTVEAPVVGATPAAKVAVATTPEGSITITEYKAEWMESETGEDDSFTAMTSTTFEPNKFYAVNWPTTENAGGYLPELVSAGYLLNSSTSLTTNGETLNSSDNYIIVFDKMVSIEVAIAFEPAEGEAVMFELVEYPEVKVTPEEAGEFIFDGTSTWTSSDEDVATVNASTGEITLVGAGTTVITVSFPGDGVYKEAEGSYTLTVKAAETSVELAEESLIAYIDEEIESPEATTDPEDLTLTWTSADESIATVDATTGVVTPLAAGTTTITAAFEGNAQYLASEATYTLIVRHRIELLAPEFSLASGTEAEPTPLAADEPLKVTFATEYLEENELTEDDVMVKVIVSLTGDVAGKDLPPTSKTAHVVESETFYLQLGESEFPEALKYGYTYDKITIESAELVINAETADEEVVATCQDVPAELEWIGVQPRILDGIIKQILSHPETGKQGEATGEQTVTISPSEDPGEVDITYSGFTMPVTGAIIPEFTVTGVTMTENEDGTITYSLPSYASNQVVIDRGTGDVKYTVALEGSQKDAGALPVLKLTLTNSVVDTVWFGADESVIDKAIYVGVEDLPVDNATDTIFDLSGRKLDKVQRKGVYIINGKKVAFK